MAATATHVAEVGYANASMRAIAQEAGLTSAAIYRYFPSKQELVITALTDLYSRVQRRLEEATSFPGTLQERFIALLEEALVSVNEHPALTRFEASVQLECGRHPEFAPVLMGRRNTEEKFYSQMIDEAVREGHLPSDVDRQALMDTLTSVTWGLSYLSATTTPERHRAAIRQVELLLAGTGPLFRP